MSSYRIRESENVELRVESDIRVEDDIKARKISRMKKWLEYRGMKIPRYLTDDEFIQYYAKWYDA